ncbi:hypothetical protein TIFTF001_047665 [Ficus carica]|uniref:Uncharacterized protein n=1 Tax=Ficus carica TaxID=3494 RepID=A0AA87Z3L3_FICCA|nr:hypothetical protein TIFTF001_047644 [Ficus carica]GMN24560.1 hypothetical protein TIFTF001_047647 [Ficus carica]GMN24724.1 hypothetical protein TIFTF001_047662 [Ficus carica]GMN24737.1 hypothetical protein TIFTF001_047665 [Ficus carica]
MTNRVSDEDLEIFVISCCSRISLQIPCWIGDYIITCNSVDQVKTSGRPAGCVKVEMVPDLSPHEERIYLQNPAPRATFPAMGIQ